MNEKLEHLIQVLVKIHLKISKKYKNMELIEGKYKPKIETIAKILRLQIEKKIDVYKTMLMDASSIEIDVSKEGYTEVLNMTKKCEEALNGHMSLPNDNIIATAIEFSEIKINLFEGVLDILNRYELEKNIKHDALKEKVIIILALEKKDSETLRSFKC